MARIKAFDTQTVLEKAMMLFWQQGYETTTVRDLVNAMGISTSSLYSTFGDKRAVYIQALKHYCKQEQTQFKALLRAPLHIEALLENLIKATENQFLGPSKGLFSINSVVEFGTRDAEVTDILWEHYQAIWRLLCEVFADPQSNIRLKPSLSPEAAAHTVLTVMYGYVSVLRVKPDFRVSESLIQSLSHIYE
jgi:TetR/AcrR family transcriptional repressor of nem operon